MFYYCLHTTWHMFWPDYSDYRANTMLRQNIELLIFMQLAPISDDLLNYLENERVDIVHHIKLTLCLWLLTVR